jgi:hypothetical protein
MQSVKSRSKITIIRAENPPPRSGEIADAVGNPGRLPRPTKLPSGDSLRQAAQTSLLELRYAAITTAITIVIAAALYATLPALITHWIREDDGSFSHRREFLVAADGGSIRYSEARPAKRATPEEHARILNEYFQDLQLLERRFERGQFLITSRSMESAEAAHAMNVHRNEFDYDVQSAPDYVELRITARNAGAREALRGYLSMLDRYWQTKS